MVNNPDVKPTTSSSPQRVLIPLIRNSVLSKDKRFVTPRNIDDIPTNLQKSISPSTKPPATPNQKNQVRTVNTPRATNIYSAKVINAYRNRQIFTIYGNFRTIRKALLDRGWIEKLQPGRYPQLNHLPDSILLKNAKRGNDYEAVIINKMVSNYPAFFIWQPKHFRDRYENVLPYRNHVRRNANLDFTTKIGLIGCAEHDHWFHLCGLCGMSYPRFYRLKNSEERSEFIEDYRRTQCRNLIRFIIENISMPKKLVDARYGKAPLCKILTYAINHMERQLSDWEYLTLDIENDIEINKFNYDEWKEFLELSTNIILEKSKFKATFGELREFAIIATEYLNIIEEKCTDFKWDGVRNLWILKPGNRSRGIGIVIKNSLDDILQWEASHRGSNYIVQKYIERPLLIYNCKFDIRQYMLLTIGEEMASIWLYRDCYLRFSTQVFSIDDLRESIHLTNNAIQKHYKITKSRDLRLPRNNMWSLEQFRHYLKAKNAPPDTWSRKIFAGFRENLIAVVLASFEETHFVENTFELYGCDFMLDEQYNPILIEINATPDLTPSTDVTARICPMVLNDLIRVVVDLPKSPSGLTGLFELVHKVNYKSIQDFDPEVGLNISGKAMTIYQKQEEVKQEKASKQGLYKKLKEKRLQLIKFLNCLNTSDDS